MDSQSVRRWKWRLSPGYAICDIAYRISHIENDSSTEYSRIRSICALPMLQHLKFEAQRHLPYAVARSLSRQHRRCSAERRWRRNIHRRWSEVRVVRQVRKRRLKPELDPL